MASLTDDEAARYVLHLYIDDGTAKAAVSMQIFRRETGPDPGESVSLHLQGSGRVETPQNWAITIPKNGGRAELKWGHMLESTMEEQDHQHDTYTFANLKVLLYPTPDVGSLQQDIVDELTRVPGIAWSPDHLQLLRLTRFREDIFDAVVLQAARTGLSKEQILNLETHTFFAVPEMATADQHVKLQELLLKAAFTNVRLVTEAEAIGAWRSYRARKTLGGQRYLFSKLLEVCLRCQRRGSCFRLTLSRMHTTLSFWTQEGTLRYAFQSLHAV